MTQNSADITESLKTIIAEEIMTTDVLTVYEGWSIKRLADFFVKHRISGAPVIASDHALVGVVTISDIVRFDSLATSDKASLIAEQVYTEYLGQGISSEDIDKLAQHADQNCTVNSIMTKEVIKLEKTATLPEIARLMHKSKIRRVFITEGDIIVGVISTGNVLSKLAEL